MIFSSLIQVMPRNIYCIPEIMWKTYKNSALTTSEKTKLAVAIEANQQLEYGKKIFLLPSGV
jgi:hypothetical protein